MCDPDKLTSEANQVLYEKILTKIPQLAREVNSDMLKFVNLIVEEAVSICGKSPCLFSVAALGSLARGETTPYSSNLEFMFLDDAKDKSTEPYFELLAMTVYFIIGSLCETKLKYLAIEELTIWNEARKRFDGH